jgi:hypothetical protein
METNQPSTVALSNSTQSAHERAVAIMKRLVADKKQAEKDIVENFHKDPLIQAAVAELKRRREERGTAAI